MNLWSLRKYLRETSLHGFGYTVTNNKFLLVFWALLTLTCVCFAIKDIITLVDTFQTVPFSTDFTTASSEDLTIPTPTVCMEMMVLPPNETFQMTDIQADISEFMVTTRNTTKINFDNTTQLSLTSRLEYLTYLMLGYITDFELMYTGDRNSLLTDYVFKYDNTSDQYVAMLQTVYDTYMDYNVSLSNLKRLVGMSICSKQLTAATYGSPLVPGAAISSMCHANTITHLSFSLLCAKLFNTSTFTLTSGLTVAMSGLVSASKPPYPVLKRKQQCRMIEEDLPTGVIFLWYIDMQGRSVVPKGSTQDVMVFDPAMPTNIFDITIVTQFQRLDVPNVRPCSSGPLQQQCEKQKKVEQLSATCNCWPSSLIDVVNTNQMPTCSGDTANRNRNVTANSRYLQCGYSLTLGKGNCINDCSSYLYSTVAVDDYQTVLKEVIGQPSELTNPYPGSVEIRFQTAALGAVTTEYLTMPLTTFLCSFGGTIGTYLGGSILAFIHIPIFVLSQIIEGLIKRKKVGTTEEPTKTTIQLSKEEIYPPVMADAKVI